MIATSLLYIALLRPVRHVPAYCGEMRSAVTKILGWWCSGYDHNDVPVICALVGEPEQEAAMAAVLIDWPEAERWRFLVRRPSEWRPGDRFPLSDWMRSRVEDSHA